MINSSNWDIETESKDAANHMCVICTFERIYILQTGNKHTYKAQYLNNYIKILTIDLSSMYVSESQ